jgi:branched-chain amino acid transport system substrate-binding protein
LKNIKTALAATALFGVLALTGCSGAAISGGGDPAPSGEQPDGSSAEPFRLGVLASYKGAFSVVGPDIIEPVVRLYLDQHDGELGGRPVEVFVADGETSPEAYVTRARELVEEDQVDAIIGIDHSGGLLAIRDYLEENQIPTITTVAAIRSITNEAQSDFIYRSAYGEGQVEPVGAVLAYDSLDYRNVAVLASDYAAPTGIADRFIESFEELGGTIATYEKPALGASDFAPYLAKIQTTSDIDAVVPVIFGADAAKFAEQYRSLGIDLPILTVDNFVEQTMALDSWGEQAIGVQTFSMYSLQNETPENEQFVQAYFDELGRLPGFISATTYTGMQILDEALSAAGPEADPAAVAAAIGEVSVSSPLGDVSFDDRNALIHDVFLNEVQETDRGIVQVSLGPVVRQVTQDVTVEDARAALE